MRTPNCIDWKRIAKTVRVDGGSGHLYCRTTGRRLDDRVTFDGYRTIKTDAGILRAHRVVYALWHRRGQFGLIDHWNGDRQDNRPMNLRACSNRENMANRLYWRRTFEGKYLAQLGPQPVGVILGEFDSMEDARQYRREIVNRAVEQWYAG